MCDMDKKIIGAMVPLALMAPVAACSSGPSQSSGTSQAAGAAQSGPSQSNLGPFTIGPCKLGWAPDDADIPGRAGSKWYVTKAQAEANANGYNVWPSSNFTITLTATAVVQSFTVAYYNSSGTEIATGTASLAGDGPDELTAGQHASFTDVSAPSGATSCQVIGSDAGNS